MHDARQHLGNLGCIGVLEVHHTNIAALLEWDVEVVNKRFDALNTQLIGSYDHAIRALIGYKRRLIIGVCTLACSGLFECLEHFNNVGRDAVFQLDDLGLFDSRLIHARNDFFHPINVRADIRNDNRVTGRVSGHVCLLGHEWAQDRNEFCGRYVL